MLERIFLSSSLALKNIVISLAGFKSLGDRPYLCDCSVNNNDDERRS